MIKTIITFILVFSILVIIHEFGHFYFAKRAGILVREFAIGMGPKLVQFRRNGTTYTIRMLPIGGYVRMAGYGDDETELRVGMPVSIVLNEQDEISTINLSERPLIESFPIELTNFDLEKELFMEGLTPGNPNLVRYSVKRDATILEQDGTEVQIAPVDVQFQSAKLVDRMMTNFAGPMNNFILGILIFVLIGFVQGGIPTNDSRVGEIVPDSPAAVAGLANGDWIRSVGDEEVDSWNEFTTEIQKFPNEEITLTVASSDATSTKEVLITPNAVEASDGTKIGQIGVGVYIEKSVSSIIAYGFTNTWMIATSIFTLIGSMFVNGFDVNAFSGPVGIYAATEQAVGFGWMSVLSLMAYLSVNLGTVNLLPIPALDGGKLVLNIIEGVRGKPLEPEKEGIITVIGVGLLFLLMIVVTWNDLQRFFFGS